MHAVPTVVSLSPHTEVTLGRNVTLRCQYKNISSPQYLVLKWSHTSSGDGHSDSLWLFDGANAVETGIGIGKSHYSRVDTDVTHEHAILLKSATFHDDGEYYCDVEYQDDEYQSYYKHRGMATLTVVGKKFTNTNAIAVLNQPININNSLNICLVFQDLPYLLRLHRCRLQVQISSTFFVASL